MCYPKVLCFQYNSPHLRSILIITVIFPLDAFTNVFVTVHKRLIISIRTLKPRGRDEELGVGGLGENPGSPLGGVGFTKRTLFLVRLLHILSILRQASYNSCVSLP